VNRFARFLMARASLDPESSFGTGRADSSFDMPNDEQGAYPPRGYCPPCERGVHADCWWPRIHTRCQCFIHGHGRTP
jgi:hypothetical protein